MFVIAGASGNTGSVVAKTLLAHKQQVRVLLRSESKAASWRDAGAEVALGDVENLEALTAALTGARGLYLLLPPDYRSTDPMDRARRINEVIAAAIERSGVQHVTLLSSVGAELASGNGIVQSLYITEQRLSKLGIGLTNLRAAYFMENWATGIAPALSGGALYSFLGPADRKLPMIATQDIGTMAAYSLMFPTRSIRNIELAGPEDYSPNDVAAALARVSNKPVNAVIAPAEGMAPMLTQFGFAAESAAEMANLTIAINAGQINFGQPDAEPIRGRTSLDQVFGNLLAAAPAHQAS